MTMSPIDPDSEQTRAPASPEVARISVFVRVALFNLFLGLVSMAAIMLIVRAEKVLAGKIFEFKERRAEECATTRVIASPKPVLVDPEGKAPPQDAAKEGYVGEKGVNISATMRLMMEAVRAGARNQETIQLRLGSEEALSSGTIHIVNLWATWCGPCQKEMPDFRALFARRPDWGEDVRFVPVLVGDDHDPVRAYREILDSIPSAPVMLADRSPAQALTTALTTTAEGALYQGRLPVTLVLDCNRRVRWAKLIQLTPQDFTELEGSIDRLRAELEDESPGAWCTQQWCGNGRCEGLEDSPGQHCPEDCGALRRTAGSVETLVDAPSPLAECPEGMIRTADGQCSRKLRGMTGTEKPPPQAVAASTCGNNACDAGESSDSCCQDCGCADSRVCKPDGEGGFKCVRALKGSLGPGGE